MNQSEPNEIPTCDVLLITVTKVEITAVFSAAGVAPNDCAMYFGSTKTYFDLGEHGGARIFVVRSETGTATVGGSLATLIEALSECQPSSAIMVGIAFGAQPDKQNIGDVLVSKQLEGYELQRVGTDEDGNRTITLRGDRVPASGKLLDRMRSCELTWTGAKIRFGLMIHGEKLVDNQDFRDCLQKLAPEMLGGEMEGGGIHVACESSRVPWIIVKGICDWADGDKGKNKSENQAVAAANAAAFVFATIRSGGLSTPQSNSSATRVVVPRKSSELTNSVLEDSSAIADSEGNVSVKLDEILQQAMRTRESNEQVAEALIAKIRASFALAFEDSLANSIQLEKHFRSNASLMDLDTKRQILVVLAEVERYMLESPKFDSDDTRLKSLLNEIETYA